MRKISDPEEQLSEEKLETDLEIIEWIIREWKNYNQSEIGQRNQVEIIRQNINHYQDHEYFEEIAQRFLTTFEEKINKGLTSIVRYHYHERLCSIYFLTSGGFWFIVPYNFIKYNIITGDIKVIENLLNRLSIRLRLTRPTLNEVVITFVNFLSNQRFSLNTTDKEILLRAARPIEYDTVTFSQNVKSFLKAGMEQSERTIVRSIKKMEQLAIFSNTVFINYKKLGLTPYLLIFREGEVDLLPEEKEFIEISLKTSGSFTPLRFNMILIPNTFEKRITENENILSYPLDYHHFFWNFSRYITDDFSFPLMEDQLQLFDENSIELIEPTEEWGIEIDLSNKIKEVSFIQRDLEIITYLREGRRNQTIAEILDLNVRVVHETTARLFKEKIIEPYLYIRNLGLSSRFFYFLEGSKEDTKKFVSVLRFLTNARILMNSSQTMSCVFGLSHVFPQWIHEFNQFMDRLEEKNIFTKIAYGWIPWKGISRHVLFPRLWNDQEKYWNFPYHI